jgi:hypothetical protein
MEAYMRSLSGLLHNVCLTLLLESYFSEHNFTAADKKNNIKGAELCGKE